MQASSCRDAGADASAACLASKAAEVEESESSAGCAGPASVYRTCSASSTPSCTSVIGSLPHALRSTHVPAGVQAACVAPMTRRRVESIHLASQVETAVLRVATACACAVKVRCCLANHPSLSCRPLLRRNHGSMGCTNQPHALCYLLDIDSYVAAARLRRSGSNSFPCCKSSALPSIRKRGPAPARQGSRQP